MVVKLIAVGIGTRMSNHIPQNIVASITIEAIFECVDLVQMINIIFKSAYDIHPITGPCNATKFNIWYMTSRETTNTSLWQIWDHNKFTKNTGLKPVNKNKFDIFC